MPSAKPHLCQDCGVTDPILFYTTAKSRCKKCTSIQNLRRLDANPAAKQLNKERAALWQRNNPIRYRWLQAKNRAARKDLEFSITESDILSLYDKQNGLCAYTGLQLSLDCSEFDLQSASIDRVDSSKGYILDNVVLCCVVVNTMKNDLSTDQFKTFIVALYETICATEA